MLPRGVGGEGELALAAVHLAHDDLVLGVPDLHVHPDLGAGGGKPVGARVIQLRLEVGCYLEQGSVGDPDPNLDPYSGSGSVFRIRILIHTGEKRIN